MKLKLSVLSSVVILMMTTSMTNAKTLSSASGWQVKNVNADIPYCTMSRTYSDNINFMIAKNKNEEGTVAFDFARPAFNVSRSYPITLKVGNVERRYDVNPASESFIVVRLGQDAAFYNAMRTSEQVSVTIDEETFSMSMGGGNRSFNELDGCLGVATPAPVMVEAKKAVPVPPQIDVSQPRINKETEIQNQKLVAQNSQISHLIEENKRLTKLLSENAQRTPVVIPKSLSDDSAQTQKIVELQGKLNDMQRQNGVLISQIAQMEKDLLSARQNINPDLSGALAERDQQIDVLKQQNQSLENALKIAESRPREIKEIIKEVPVYVGDAPGSDNAQLSLKLAEAETLLKTYEAERDEYQRLLQIERRRARENGTNAIQSADAGNSLLADVQRLEKEKVELIRQLEFAKKTGTVVQDTDKNDAIASELNALSAKLVEAQNKLAQSEQDKQKLQKRMAVIDSEAVMMQRQLAESKIAKLADDRPEVVHEQLEAKTLRSEIAALEAQNNMLRADFAAEKQKAELKASEPIDVANRNVIPNVDHTGRVSRPMDRDVDVQSLRNRLAQPTQNIEPTSKVIVSAPTIKRPNAPQMIALSGDEIRQLLAQSKIPLQSSIDRVDRISGPDFAAFKWDTGFVYGSGEQSRLSDVSAFNKSVQQYIQKTASRCDGSFDQNIQSVNTPNGMTAQSADIACVDDNANGSAASILFFVRNGMFYALAHEADMDSFKVAMDMRDRLIGSIDQIY